MEEETLRKMAVEQYLRGKPSICIYQEMGRSKKWFFKWLKRYQTGQDDWYKDQPRAPLQKPAQIDETERQRIISIRKRLESESFAQIGVSAIKWELSKLGLSFPSDRTINRILKTEGLVKKNFVSTQRSRISVLH